SQLFHSVNGVGAHEVIIETPEHEHHLSMQSEFQVQEIITAYKQRYLDLIRDKRFKYILIFKNHGERAGASISHPHSQLIATTHGLPSPASSRPSWAECTGSSMTLPSIITSTRPPAIARRRSTTGTSRSRPGSRRPPDSNVARASTSIRSCRRTPRRSFGNG